MLGLQRKRKTQARGGLSIAKGRFVLGVTVPMMLYMSIGIFTLAWAFILMFFNYSSGRAGGAFLGLGGSNPFIGLDNFVDMIKGVSLQAKSFRTSLGNTLIFAALVLPLNLAITLPLAGLLESISARIKPLYRTIYFLPVLTSSVGVALIWQTMYHPQSGWINAILGAFSIQGKAWLADPRAGFLGISVAMWAVIIAYLWQDYGYNMVIFIAALQGIPHELKEAAMIDGANPWQVFTRVTIPLIRPTLLFVMVMTMISSFQVFDIIQVMTNGAPNNQTQVLMLDIYKNAFRYQKLGFAVAESFVLFLVVMAVTLFQMRVLRKNWEY